MLLPGTEFRYPLTDIPTVDFSPINAAVNLDEIIDHLQGPTVEVVGPTPDGYPIVNHRLTSPLVKRYAEDISELPDDPGSIAMLLVSGLPKYRETVESDHEHALMLGYNAYDEYYYAEQGTRGHIGRSLHLDLAIAAGRLIMPGGLLVWRDIQQLSASLAGNEGLTMIANQNSRRAMVSPFGRNDGVATFMDAVFQKAG